MTDQQRAMLIEAIRQHRDVDDTPLFGAALVEAAQVHAQDPQPLRSPGKRRVRRTSTSAKYVGRLS